MLSTAGASGEQVLRGIPVSPGVCRGRILVVSSAQDHELPRIELPPSEIPLQLQRLERALVDTRREIQQIQREISERLGAGDASIFDAHLHVLDDPMLLPEVKRCITEEHLSAEFAFKQTAEKFVRGMAAINDEYLRERATDLRDVIGRVLNHLLGRADHGVLRQLHEPAIIIALDLTPTQTALLDKKMVLGFATDMGSRTSHTAIMARSMRIPAVVGLQHASRDLTSGPITASVANNSAISMW